VTVTRTRTRRSYPIETYRLVFRRTSWLLVIAVLLLAACAAGSRLLAGYNAGLKEVSSGLVPPEAVVPDDGAGPEQKQGTVLQLTTPVGREYFADTVFIGDSITTGIYSVAGEVFGEEAVAVAKLGLSTHSALTDAFYVVPDASDIPPMTAVEAVEYYRPRKVYIMLGTNGLNYETIDWNVEGFTGLVTEIRARMPGVYIVIQSIPPVTADCAAGRPEYTRDKIDEYNGKLLNLALQKGVYYLDLCTSLSDQGGNLRSDVAAADGMHLTLNGYQVWYDCIVSHAVKGESSYILDEDGRIVYQPQEQAPEEEEEGQGEEAPPEEEEPQDDGTENREGEGEVIPEPDPPPEDQPPDEGGEP